MPYTVTNYKSKKQLKLALLESDIPVFQPGPFGPQVKDGRNVIEGPHYPEPNRWYASVEIRNGVIPKGSKVS